MTLNLDIVFYELSQLASCQLFGDTNKCSSFNYTAPLLEGSSVNRDVLYICSPGNIGEETKEGAYICAGRPEFFPTNPGILIITVENVTKDKLFELVITVFHKYTDWDNALLRALNDSEPLKAMVKCSRGLFANPISVMDRDFHLLVQPYDRIEEYLSHNINSTDEDGFLPIESVNFFKNDPYFNALNNKRGAFLYPANIMPYKSLCINLFKDSEYIARVIVFDSNSQFRPFDNVLLEHLALYMEPCFSFSALQLMPDLRGLRGLLISVLEGIGERSVTELSLASREWSSSDKFLWLHLLQTEHDINNRTAYYTCSKIEKLFQETCAIQWSGGISVLSNLTAAHKTPDEYLRGFEEFSIKGCFRTGVSNCFVGTEHLVDYHQQAMIAAVTGKERSPDIWLYKFADYAVHYLLQNAVHHLPAILCCHPIIQIFSTYDAENDTEYIKTLRCYLNNQMNAIETSRQLFIHRSTMNFRLSRIKELSGIDWNDKELAFYLMLSLKILDEYHH